MRVISKLTVFLAFVTFAYGCVFPYELELHSGEEYLVIHGKVTDREGYQYIEVSRNVSLNNQDLEYHVSDCLVAIQDDKGNVFEANEVDPGLYAAWIRAEYLTTGTRFQLTVTTPKGRNYVSEYDELMACPPIDSIQWEVEEMLSDDADHPVHQGVQFYLTTDGSGEYARNFRWKLSEAWEYHSLYQISVVQYYKYGPIIELEEPSDSLRYCWGTRLVDQIFTYSTGNLESRLVRRFPLYFVSDRTDKLSIKYSLHVTQMGLTNTAYEYWKILEKQSSQSADLFETQPEEIIGNIYSLDDPEETVYGLFYASSIRERRIMIRPGIDTWEPDCFPMHFLGDELDVLLESFLASYWPFYFVKSQDLGGGPYDFAPQICFDCTKRGGSLEPPEYWK